MRGHDVARHPLDVRRQIAVVLQQNAVEALLSVRDNRLIYAYLHGSGRQQARERMRTVAEEFDLADRLDETVYDLSIGTKRRVQVAKTCYACAFSGPARPSSCWRRAWRLPRSRSLVSASRCAPSIARAR